MIIKKEKAFTLIEILVVVMMIGILILATTVYLGGTDEKRKVIESQGCINRIGGEISNFIFYTLTSKSLKIGGEPISPDYYIIEFADDEIILGGYKTLNSSNTCHQNNQLRFYPDSDGAKTIKMNKGFSPKKINDGNVFTPLTGEILIKLCFDSECTNLKEIGKFVVDGRSQTISVRNCKIYDETNLNECKTREGCKVYDDTDPTICIEY